MFVAVKGDYQMNPILRDSPYRLMRWSLAALDGALVVLVLSSGVGADPAPRPSAAAAPAVPLVQQFEDVPDTNPFATFVNALFQDNIISGYTCGGLDEPCVPPGNRPYYRPNNTVTRAQMAKFVENGRRNID